MVVKSFYERDTYSQASIPVLPRKVLLEDTMLGTRSAEVNLSPPVSRSKFLVTDRGEDNGDELASEERARIGDSGGRAESTFSDERSLPLLFMRAEERFGR